MATRRSNSGATSGWTGGAPTAGATTSSAVGGTAGTAGTAQQGRPAEFRSNVGLLPSGPRTSSVAPVGYSPFTSTNRGWTAGTIAARAGQNFGVGLRDPGLASRTSGAAASPGVGGNVLTGSVYRQGNLPGFLAGAAADLNSGQNLQTAMQAEWLNRLANSMGDAGDDSYLWAEVLRSQGFGGSGMGTGGNRSFGAGITPPVIARGQANLLLQQAQEVQARAHAAQLATQAWGAGSVEAAQLARERAAVGSGWSPAPVSRAANLMGMEAQYDLGLQRQRALTGIANPNQRNLINQMVVPATTYGPIPYTPIPYTALPY